MHFCEFRDYCYCDGRCNCHLLYLQGADLAKVNLHAADLQEVSHGMLRSGWNTTEMGVV